MIIILNLIASKWYVSFGTILLLGTIGEALSDVISSCKKPGQASESN